MTTINNKRKIETSSEGAVSTKYYRKDSNIQDATQTFLGQTMMHIMLNTLEESTNQRKLTCAHITENFSITLAQDHNLDSTTNLIASVYNASFLFLEEKKKIIKDCISEVIKKSRDADIMIKVMGNPAFSPEQKQAFQQSVKKRQAKIKSGYTLADQVFFQTGNGDLLNLIFDYLSFQELGRLAPVCKKFQAAAKRAMVNLLERFSFEPRGLEVTSNNPVLKWNKELKRKIAFFSSLASEKLRGINLSSPTYDSDDDDSDDALVFEPLTNETLNELFSKLKHPEALQILNLANNVELSDPSQALAKCSELQLLNLSSCSSITDLAVKNIAKKCSKLKIFIANSGTQIGVKGVAWLAHQCRELMELDLSRIYLGHLGFKAISHYLSQLKKLTLDDLNIQDVDIQILSFPSLTSANFACCRSVTLAGWTSFLQKHPNLEEVAFRCLDLDTPIVDQIVEVLINTCKKLKKVDFHYTKISDSAIERLVQNSPHLKEANFSQCMNISNRGARAIATHCKELEILDLRFNQQISLEEISIIAESCPRLTIFHICYFFYKMSTLTPEQSTQRFGKYTPEEAFKRFNELANRFGWHEDWEDEASESEDD